MFLWYGNCLLFAKDVHMKSWNILEIFCLLYLGTLRIASQESGMFLTLNLQQSIKLAQSQSPDAQAALHTYRSAYWNYRAFRANYLPGVELSASPYLNRQINKVTQPDGTELFISQNQLSTDLHLTVSQNVRFTGGTFFLETSGQYIGEFSKDDKAFSSQPISIGYRQSLFGYNSLKWDRKIEPVRFREARKAYAETMELIAAQTCELFFSLATAQTNLNIAQANMASADTLYRYALGRYRIGKVSENELLQLEVNKLNEETNVMQANIAVEDARLAFCSFVGLEATDHVNIVPSDSIEAFEIPLEQALELAYAHSPDVEMFRRQQLESRRQLAAARADCGLKADLYLRFGLSQTGTQLKDAYKRLLDQEYVSVAISIPILDWGRGKGKVRVAQSNIELVETQTRQGLNDFELNICKMVRQFNLQARQVAVAAKTDVTAFQRYEITRRLYLSGRSTVLELNASITEKDSARRNHIEALKTYWTLYYVLRSVTQYDFRNGCALYETVSPVHDT